MSDEHYRQLAEEVLALPVRKRKSWTSYMLDMYGCRNSVRYAPQDVGLGVQALFEVRVSAQTAGDLKLPVGSWLPVESLGIVAEKAARRQVSCEMRIVLGSATRPPAGFTISEQGFDEMAHAMIAEHLTGNHRPHAHPVRIPTAAGQPVRG
jgi:hypothetical protein